MSISWADQYEAAWNRFVEELSSALSAAANSEFGNRSIHDALRKAYDIPYQSLIKLGKTANELTNGRSGSASGPFFEGLAAAVAFGSLRRACKTAEVARNSYGSSPSPAALPREPDLFLAHCGRKIVIEVKAQVHTSVVNWCRELRGQYRAAGYEYFLIAGWFSASQSCLNALKLEEPWISILAGNARVQGQLDEMTSVDEILADICRCQSTSNESA